MLYALPRARTVSTLARACDGRRRARVLEGVVSWAAAHLDLLAQAAEEVRLADQEADRNRHEHPTCIGRDAL
jgi:hypothetical protein